MKEEIEVLIIGGGIVGLTLAYQLIKRNLVSDVLILDKEKSLGMHTSGRNGGVLLSGIFYETNSLKAKVCREGSEG